MPSPTFTTKLGLRKPDPDPATGDLIDAAADLNANWDKVDAALDRFCTSSTRPTTNLFVGLRAYETDTHNIIVITSLGPTVWQYASGMVTVSALANITTPYTDQCVLLGSDNKFYRWSGSAWVAQGNGRIDRTLVSSTATVTTTDAIQVEQSNSILVITNRVYQTIHVRDEAHNGTPNNRVNKYRVSNGALVIGSAQYDESCVAGLQGGYNTYTYIAYWTASFTGNAIFGLSSSVNTATSLVSGRNRSFSVTDVTATFT